MFINVHLQKSKMWYVRFLTIDWKLNPRLASSYATARNSSQLISPTISQGKLQTEEFQTKATVGFSSSSRDGQNIVDLIVVQRNM